MFQKKQNKTARNTDTVIGEGIVLEDALLKGKGVVRIDGKFSGTIDIEGHLIVSRSGGVNGRINAGSALFAGKYEGDLHITDTLHLTSSAVLTGQIKTGKLIIDEGAVFNGACNVEKTNERAVSVIRDQGPEAGGK